MTRIFVDGEIKDGSSVRLGDDKLHYLSVVLKCRPGERVIVTDSAGNVHTAVISSLHRKEAILIIGKRHEPLAEPPIDIILLQGLLKGDKMDLVVQKATELGVKRILPLVTERSQLRDTRKTVRWRKIAEEASRQCGRRVIPAIEMPVDFAMVFDDALFCRAGCIIFWEQQGIPYSSSLRQFRDRQQLVLCVGPEGGFSEREVTLAAGHKFIATSLGKRILRAETAAISALAIAQYELGDLSIPEQESP